MALIRSLSGGEPRLLEADHTVGRLPHSSLVIDEAYVSKRHAILHFSCGRWELRDLGSRNGTYINGQVIKAGDDLPLPSGARFAFGKLEQAWELVDDAPPVAMAVPLDGGSAVTMDGEMLALPSSENPQATIYASSRDTWVLEQPDSISEIANQQSFEVDKRLFRFSCPYRISKTALADAGTELQVQHLRVSFSVSRDEEFVGLVVGCGLHEFDLGSRQHNYLLLTLARRRQQDAAEGLPDAACGWLYLEDIAHDPTMAPPQLNIDVFRIRRQFEAIGVLDPVNVIERRPRTKQIRLGVSRVSIVVI